MKLRTMHPRRSQAGFSIVELLVAAFIMAVGLLGLAALETVALQSGTRSKGFNTAILVAGQVLETAESQGRQTQLALVNSQTPPVYAPNYFSGNPVVERFTFRGLHPDATATNPVDKTPYFTATTTAVQPPGVASPAASGSLSIVTTVVTFQEAGASGGPLITRTVTLSRNIAHG